LGGTAPAAADGEDVSWAAAIEMIAMENAENARSFFIGMYL
jgi:hypothetical protein